MKTNAPGSDATAGRFRLASQHNVDSGENQLQLRLRQLADAFRKEPLSTVTTCETLATESFGNRVVAAERATLPGAAAHFRLLVSGTQTTVAMWLRFRASDCTNHDWTPETRRGTYRLGEVRPPDVALRDHHSVCSRSRRAAAETKASLPWPTSVQTWS